MKRRLLMTVVLLGILALAVPANALIITPDSGAINVSRWEGDHTGQNFINAVINPIMANFGTVIELYKQDADDGESGPLASNYETTFNGDLSGGSIQYVAGGSIEEPAFLLVKDGNNNPAWYLFNLTSIFGWDGMEILELQNFWPGNGAISHVTLYGARSSVPEPGTMILLGSGLIGLAGWGRKKFRK